MAHEGTPHRMVDNILDSAANAGKSLVSGITGGLTGAGSQVQRALDMPFEAMGGPEQPLHIVDRFLDGAVRATVHAINQGAIGTLQEGGEAVQSALDQPVDQFSIPPSLGAGLGRFKMPSPAMGKGLGGFKLPTLPEF